MSNVLSAIDVTAIISIAFFGSLGHCIGMCGGFVMAYTSAKISPKSRPSKQFFLHLTYNSGRVSAYVILGCLFGYLGSVIGFSTQSTGYFYFITGILMVLMGLSLMGEIRFLTSLESSMASHSWVKILFSRLIHSKSWASFYGLGMLNGFIPCGLVYFFLAMAARTGSMVQGALVMLLFGLSTMPVLLGLGAMVGFLQAHNLRGGMLKLASLAIIIYGIYMAYLGFSAVVS